MHFLSVKVKLNPIRTQPCVFICRQGRRKWQSCSRRDYNSTHQIYGRITERLVSALNIEVQLVYSCTEYTEGLSLRVLTCTCISIRTKKVKSSLASQLDRDTNRSETWQVERFRDYSRTICELPVLFAKTSYCVYNPIIYPISHPSYREVNAVYCLLVIYSYTSLSNPCTSIQML